MSDYRLRHLDDAALLHELHALTTRDRATTAALLAHIAEVDARRLYLPAAYSSMFAYCVGELRFSEDAAYKRIQVARAARRFPRLFTEIASGRLHLTAVGLVAPHLTESNFGELVSAATHCGRAEIEAWLAKRFTDTAAPTPAALQARVLPVRIARALAVPAPELPSLQRELDPPEFLDQLVPEQVDLHTARSTQPTPLQADPPLFIVRVPIGEATHAKLRRAQNLLAHSVPSGDLAELLDRALDALITTLERRKAAQTDRPANAKPKRAALPRGRTIPAAVRRAVWERDEGRCTFTSEQGRRCASTRGLEFDHVVPFARGGEATFAGLRLRCRPHNLLAAERAFGVAFMRSRRSAGRGHGDPPPC